MSPHLFLGGLPGDTAAFQVIYDPLSNYKKFIVPKMDSGGIVSLFYHKCSEMNRYLFISEGDPQQWGASSQTQD